MPFNGDTLATSRLMSFTWPTEQRSIVFCIGALMITQFLYAWVSLEARLNFDSVLLCRSEDESRSTRRLRVTRLCTYLQHRYSQLCHVERAAARQQRCRHAFRRALLQAASNEPDYTGQLLRDLKTGPPTQPRSATVHR